MYYALEWPIYVIFTVTPTTMKWPYNYVHQIVLN